MKYPILAHPPLKTPWMREKRNLAPGARYRPSFSVLICELFIGSFSGLRRGVYSLVISNGDTLVACRFTRIFSISCKFRWNAFSVSLIEYFFLFHFVSFYFSPFVTFERVMSCIVTSVVFGAKRDKLPKLIINRI